VELPEPLALLDSLEILGAAGTPTFICRTSDDGAEVLRDGVNGIFDPLLDAADLYFPFHGGGARETVAAVTDFGPGSRSMVLDGDEVFYATTYPDLPRLEGGWRAARSSSAADRHHFVFRRR
jgi:hypothetical protein